MRTLPETLLSEKNNRYQGGIYHRLQIDFAYNSNHIEGSRLTHEQTKYIYETKTIGSENASVNDIIETVNHFRCFDYILDTLSQPLTEDYIRNLHRILKTGVFEDDAVIGEYKTFPNEVGLLSTALPEEVPEQIRKLLTEYGNTPLTLYEIADFHQKYEKIHPFYDGNGRTGRLLMFKQCLENHIIPFFIDDFHKRFYYMGLEEWQTSGKDERLISVFLSAQDYMKKLMDYFRIEYDHTDDNYQKILAQAKKSK